MVSHAEPAFKSAKVALSSMMRRWEGGISAEVRAEIMTEAYEPVLRTLMLARRRPIPR
jgi:hypothetical protein